MSLFIQLLACGKESAAVLPWNWVMIWVSCPTGCVATVPSPPKLSLTHAIVTEETRTAILHDISTEKGLSYSL